jgi:hypothetical protein
MKIAFITTHNSMEEITPLGNIEFCLVPYLDILPKYKEYFYKKEKGKKFIICDDTIAEDGGRIKLDEFIEKVIGLNPSEVIIPDVIGNYEETKNKRELFLDKYFNMLLSKNIKIMAVVQGKNIEEYTKCLSEINSDSRINTIGIPFRMNYAKFFDKSEEENHMLNRLLFINTMNFLKPIHCLGVNLPQEIISLKYTNKVRSCDTKLMSRYGLNELVFDKDDTTKPKRKLYLDDDMTEKQINFTIQNIEKLKEILRW